MDELISRQAAIDALDKRFDNIPMEQTTEILQLRRDLRQLQSAEPKIIHCEDCKHWDTTWQNDYAPNYHYCPMIDSTRRNDFYCADAERREETT